MTGRKLRFPVGGPATPWAKIPLGSLADFVANQPEVWRGMLNGYVTASLVCRYAGKVLGRRVTETEVREEAAGWSHHKAGHWVRRDEEGRVVQTTWGGEGMLL